MRAAKASEEGKRSEGARKHETGSEAGPLTATSAAAVAAHDHTTEFTGRRTLFAGSQGHACSGGDEGRHEARG